MADNLTPRGDKINPLPICYTKTFRSINFNQFGKRRVGDRPLSFAYIFLSEGLKHSTAASSVRFVQKGVGGGVRRLALLLFLISLGPGVSQMKRYREFQAFAEKKNSEEKFAGLRKSADMNRH